MLKNTDRTQLYSIRPENGLLLFGPFRDPGRRGHYVMAVCILYNDVANTYNFIHLCENPLYTKRFNEREV